MHLDPDPDPGGKNNLPVFYLSTCILPVYMYFTCLQVFYLSTCILPVYKYSTCLPVFYLSTCILPVYMYSTCLPVSSLSTCILPVYLFVSTYLLVSLRTYCSAYICIYLPISSTAPPIYASIYLFLLLLRLFMHISTYFFYCSAYLCIYLPIYSTALYNLSFDKKWKFTSIYIDD